MCTSPATSAFPVQSDDYAAMSLVEPPATVIYGFEKLRIDPTKSVLINGVGTIGLLFLQLAKAAHVRQITVSDLCPEKLATAALRGVDQALCPTESAQQAQLKALGQRGFDIVIDCAGRIGSMQCTVDCIAFGGQILLFGLCAAEREMTVKPFRLYQKDAAIMTSFALNRRAFRKAVALLETGAIRTDLILDSVVSLTELEPSIRRIAAGTVHGKIVVDTTISFQQQCHIGPVFFAYIIIRAALFYTD